MLNKKAQSDTIGIVITAIAIFGVAAFFMFIIPILKPWWAEQNGKAELAQAEQNRQIAVLEATAKADSAKKLAEAEVSRAEGVAKANSIIGESLKNNEAYLKYLWITDVATNGDKTVVYIPTETQLPILEATQLKK